jgi:epoxyqueuosine reductase QueG
LSIAKTATVNDRYAIKTQEKDSQKRAPLGWTKLCSNLKRDRYGDEKSFSMLYFAEARHLCIRATAPIKFRSRKAVMISAAATTNMGILNPTWKY